MTLIHLIKLDQGLQDLLVGVFGQSRIEALLQQVLDKLTHEEILMTQEMQALTDEVSRNRSTTQSAIQLIQGLATQIQNSMNDPAALQALVTTLREQDDQLASAVVANTPAQNQGGGTGSVQA